MNVMSGADLPAAWTVTVDAEGDAGDEPVDPDLVESLIDLLGDYSPSVSHRPRRYSTRVTVYAGEALEAAEGAVGLWRDARQRAGLPRWPVVRVDVNRVD
jgi:hypothetical protein